MKRPTPCPQSSCEYAAIDDDANFFGAGEVKG